MALVVVAGCAPLRNLDKDNKLSDEQRLRRRTQITQKVTRNRDAADLLSARNHCDEGNLDEAREILARILERSPERVDARLLLAEVEIAAERPKEAVRLAEEVLKKQPNDAPAHYTLALALDAAGDARLAAEHFRQAAQLDARNEVYAASYQAAEATGNNDSAGRNEQIDREELRELLAPLEQALATADGAAAWKVYQAARARHAKQESLPVAAAVLSLRHNQPELAVRILSEAARQFPKSAAVERNLGAAHFRLGDYKSSQVALQQAIALDKSCALTYFLMGCTLAKLGQEQSAEDYLRQAQVLDPRYSVRR